MADKNEVLSGMKLKPKSPWVPASLSVDAATGEYVIRMPASIKWENVKASSTGKTLVSTIRVEMGATRTPMVVHDVPVGEIVVGKDANGVEVLKTETADVLFAFGSVNINLSLTLAE